MIGGSGGTPWSDPVGGRAAVTFNEVLRQTIVMLQQHGRVSYRALKRQFVLDDTFLSDWCFMLVSPAVQSGKEEQFACIHEVRYGVMPVGLSRGVFSPSYLISLRYVERVERTCAVYRAAVAAV
jgi:hypothetical protein